MVLAVSAVASVTLAAVPGAAADPPAPPPTAPAAPVAVTAPVAPPPPADPAPPVVPAPANPAPPVVPAPPADPAPPVITVPPAGPVPPPVPASPADPVPSSAPATVPALPPFGAFLDSGAAGVAGMEGLSSWLGGTELKVAHTYLPGDRWRDIEGPPGFLDAWARWRREKADRTLVLNVPMQERNEEDVPDARVRRLLWRAAAGAFDGHFRILAERLVELGVPDTVLVLGWEMNGITYTHRCGPDPAAWKAYWNRIVATMRAVPGQRFRFDFTPSRGRDAVPWTACYPGDGTVDVIGMDAYDQPAGLPFEDQVTEPYGLQQHVDFARAHGKPVSYPEWGLFRNGDNPEYMRGMLTWIDEQRPLYQTLTDYCPHGVWQCPANPRSAEVYRTALYGRAGQPAPVPPAVTPPAPVPPGPTPPPESPPPAVCSPLDLGDWTAYWLGRTLCPRFGRWPLDS
ncbi:glycoside hydrolase family 26 protein [Streptomyces sp. NPDC017082]|uniref:glycoside hydrolase family 26 protein n=1 Tax=Streptomyces sp. NPDC017082 TaxID=3364974 RepID=UPI0037B0E987